MSLSPLNRRVAFVATAVSLALGGCAKRPISAQDGGAVPIDGGVPDGAPPIDAAAEDAAIADGARPKLDAAAACRVTTTDGGTVACTEMLVGFELENNYCALKPGGALRCWSDQDYFNGVLAPLVAKAPPGLVQISAADTILADPLLCGVDAQGNGTCWGMTTTMNMGGGLASVVVSRYGTCALHRDGRINCSGGIPPLPADRRYVQIAVAADFMIGLDDTGTPVYSQGDLRAPPGVYLRVATIGGSGAALRDDGALVFMNGPQPLVMPGAFVELSLDQRRLCGIDGAGEITCFPLAAGGPAPLSPPAGPFSRIVGGYTAMCGLRPTGTTTCWGEVPVSVPDGW